MLLLPLFFACADLEDPGVVKPSDPLDAGGQSGATTPGCGDVVESPISDLQSPVEGLEVSPQQFADAEAGRWVGAFGDGTELSVEVGFVGAGVSRVDACSSSYALEMSWALDSALVQADLSVVMVGNSVSRSRSEGELPYAEAEGSAAPTGFSAEELPGVMLRLLAGRVDGELTGELEYVGPSGEADPAGSGVPTSTRAEESVGGFSLCQEGGDGCGS